MNILYYNSFQLPTSKQKQEIINFLYEHLEQYGDQKSAISKCVDYAIKESPSFGGFILVASLDNKIVGVTVINQTGMKEYIPENILVYIATHNGYRGKGIGKKLMQKAIEQSKGSIALHVEPDNPAKKLYEKLGFVNKYLEMRLEK